MFRRPVVLGLLLGLLVTPAARADSLSGIRAKLAVGDRAGARALADSLLPGLPPDLQGDADYLRAQLEEDGARMEEFLRSYLRTSPEGRRAASAHLKLGKLAFARADFLGANGAFRAARDAGREEEGSLWEGLAAFALGDVSAARAALEQAASSGNARIRQHAQFTLGEMARLGRDASTAERWYEAVREESGPGPGWWSASTYYLAETLESQGDFDASLDLLTELVRLHPESYEAPLARARLRLEAVTARPDMFPEPPPDSAMIDASLPPRPWTVQAGAFSVASNAELLAADLRAGGFPEVRVLALDGLHRVYVGRFTMREEAEALGDSLVSALDTGFRVIRTDRPE